MGVRSSIYVIAGYDLSGAEGDKYEDFIENCDNDHWWDNPQKGKIQLFTDQMCGEYLYLGYILGQPCQYECDTEILSVVEIDLKRKYVQDKLWELADKGVVNTNKLKSPYSIIIFEDYH